MRRDNNVNNVNNEASFNRSYNVNNVNNVDNERLNRAKLVDDTADKLVRKFQAPGSRNFFCKCAWKLTQDQIWTTFERSQSAKVRCPIKYFVASCYAQMNN